MLIKHALGDVYCHCGENEEYYSLLSNPNWWVCENPFGPCIYTREEYNAVDYPKSEDKV